VSAATAVKAGLEKDHPWAKLHASFPVIRGGDLTSEEAGDTNAAIVGFVQSLLVHPDLDGRCSPTTCDFRLECVATLATRDLTAVACVGWQEDRIGGTPAILSRWMHAAFHFVPRTARPTDLLTLFGGDPRGKLASALIDTYDKVNEEVWDEHAPVSDPVVKARIVATAAVMPYGLLMQEGASSGTGYDVTGWDDVADAIPTTSIVATFAKNPPPSPTGDAAWKWR
jgi:hypothetical protein